MVEQTLEEKQARLLELRAEIKGLEDQHKPLHDEGVELSLKLVACIEESWGLKLALMFPGVPITEDSCLAEVRPTDNLNKADALGKAVTEQGEKVVRIEYDTKRKSYRLYGAATPAVAQG